MVNTGIIILAAGSSSRFGTLKQLAHFGGKTLLQHAVSEALGTGAKPVVVVTGANAEEVSHSINDNNIEIAENADWKKGMASGIVTGIQKVITLNAHIERLIIAVCDQPFVNSALFNQLYQTHMESKKNIVASAYADTLGTPVLFTQKYFDQLLNLKGDEGAKKILKLYNEVYEENHHMYLMI